VEDLQRDLDSESRIERPINLPGGSTSDGSYDSVAIREEVSGRETTRRSDHHPRLRLHAVRRIACVCEQGFDFLAQHRVLCAFSIQLRGALTGR
jgi:hypothetical protein